MKKRVTIVDIAHHLGVTPSTVSKAFSDHPRISPKTKQAVLAMSNRLGYYPNSLATGLRRGKSGLIGVLVPGIQYSFFSTAIKGIEDTLSKVGYNVIITQSKDEFEIEKKQLRSLANAQVEGIIASLALGSKEYNHYLSIANQMPLVLFDRTLENTGISKVMIDDFDAAVSAIDHLVSMNYKKIAFIGGFEHSSIFHNRIKGYKFGLQKHQIEIRDDYILQCAPYTIEGSRMVALLMEMKDPPDAIFAASDYLAFGAMEYLLSQGYSIPEQIGIIGFSNEEFSKQVTPSLTTIDQFSEKMGIMAAELLIEQLTFRSSELPFTPQTQILNSQLVIRASSSRN